MRLFLLSIAMGALILSAAVVEAQAFCIKKDKTELKDAPKKNARTIVMVDRFTPLQGTGKTEPGWVQVTDFEGEKFWAQRRTVTTAYKCLVVRRKTSKVRSGPGAGFPISDIGTAERSQAFKDLSGEDGWNRVESADGKSGWIDLNHVWQPINHRFRMSFEKED